MVLWATAWNSCLFNDLQQSHSIRHGGFKPPLFEVLWDSSDQEWIENNRELERIVREMRGLSSRVLAFITGREAP